MRGPAPAPDALRTGRSLPTPRVATRRWPGAFTPGVWLWPVKTSRGALAGFQPFARSPISPRSCRSLARTHGCLVPDPPWASRQELPRRPLAATCGLARWGSAPEPPGTRGQAPGLQAGDAHPAGLPLRVGPGQLRGRQLLAPPPVPLQTARRPAPAGCLPDRLSLCLSTGRRVLCHHSAPSGRRHFWIQRDRVCLRPLRYCGARRPEAGTGLRPAAAPEGRCLAPFPRRLSKVAAPPRSHSWWGQIGNPTPAYRCHPQEARIPLGNFKLRETKLSGQAPDSGISHRKKENSVTTSIWIINAGLTITLLKNSALGKGDINWLFEHIVLLLVTKGHLFSHIFFILECALGLQLIHSGINF